MTEIAYVLLGAFVGGLLTYLTALRTLYNDSVVSERKAWRDRIREIALAVVESAQAQDFQKLNLLRHDLEIRLNPGDPKDIAILKCAILQSGDDNNCETSKKARDEFVSRVSILLKHDWERVKLETSLWKKYFFTSERPNYSENQNGPEVEEFRALKYSVIFVVIVAALFLVPFIVESHLYPLAEGWLSGLSFILSFIRAE